MTIRDELTLVDQAQRHGAEAAPRLDCRSDAAYLPALTSTTLRCGYRNRPRWRTAANWILADSFSLGRDKLAAERAAQDEAWALMERDRRWVTCCMRAERSYTLGTLLNMRATARAFRGEASP